ncbi:uncharacterized protein LOC34621446 [Cyclospora cayetanensis]|uniref:Uncharacterized protein LOC34621446 n=1 Tax=Cyclospora cayetanensis TaxID=88456 RepID=A0A6P6RRJ4_9EIME|nr:uncharacterized protein LOC34621446 [Cyclospora cayetanensis]
MGKKQLLWMIALALLAVIALGRWIADALDFQHRHRQGNLGSPQGTSEHAYKQQSEASGDTVYHDYALPSWYHSYAEMLEELQRLGSSCGLELMQKTEDGVRVDFFVLKASSIPSERLFLLAGDHAREVVAPEVVFAFLKTLCRGEGLPQERASLHARRSNLEVMAVLSVSSAAREAGAYCMRTNPRGADLNRDWEASAAAATIGLARVGRPQQPETRILQSVLKEYQPTAFVSVHSGDYGVYLPSGAPSRPQERHFSSDRDGPSSSFAEGTFMGAASKQETVAGQVRASACVLEDQPCDFGSIANFFHAKGNELDWVMHTLGAPTGQATVVLALEVYRQQRPALKTAVSELISLLGATEALLETPLPEVGAVADLLPVPLAGHKSRFLAGAPPTGRQDAESLTAWQLARPPGDRISCFLHFNPSSRGGLRAVVDHWVGTLFALVQAL